MEVKKNISAFNFGLKHNSASAVAMLHINPICPNLSVENLAKDIYYYFFLKKPALSNMLGLRPIWLWAYLSGIVVMDDDKAKILRVHAQEDFERLKINLKTLAVSWTCYMLYGIKDGFLSQAPQPPQLGPSGLAACMVEIGCSLHSNLKIVPHNMYDRTRMLAPLVFSARPFEPRHMDTL